MCLAIPGKLIEVFDDRGLRMGRVDFGGTRQSVCLATVPEARVGEYVIVHAGFALGVLDEEAARLSLAALAEMARAGEAEGSARRAPPHGDPVGQRRAP